MVRKTAKQIREEEELMLKSLRVNIDENATKEKSNELFKNIENQKTKTNATSSEIISFFQKNAIGKQGSFYLNKDLMKLLRTKSVQEGNTIAEVVRGLLLEHYFTKDELREVYLKSDI